MSKYVVQTERLRQASQRFALSRAVSRFLAYTIINLVALITRNKKKLVCHKTPRHKNTYLLTGRFESAGWMRAHILPLARCSTTERIFIVTEKSLPPIKNVVYVSPPKLIRTIIGSTGARLLAFSYYAAKNDIDVVGGFHLLVNGLMASVLSAIFRKKSIYFCVGGWSEIKGGGAFSGVPLFGDTGIDDAVLEQKLACIIKSFDFVITMGEGAKNFLSEKGCTNVFVNPGGINESIFYDKNLSKDLDTVVVARLDQVKRLDLYIEAIGILRKRFPNIKSAIVGDGPEKERLLEKAEALCLSDNIIFAGHQSNIYDWLNRSRMFVLTSDSEGVPLSSMEALMVGIPVIATDVGDLRDLVNEGVNGFIVPPGDSESIANAIAQLLSDPVLAERMTLAAKESSSNFSLNSAVERWDRMTK